MQNIKIEGILTLIAVENTVHSREHHKWPKKQTYPRFNTPLHLEEFREKTFLKHREILFTGAFSSPIMVLFQPRHVY